MPQIVHGSVLIVVKQTLEHLRYAGVAIKKLK
jgi:hypothetical protein